MRIKISKSRRETLRETEQPAKKRRKTGTLTYKRVMEQKQEGEKRKQEVEDQKNGKETA